MAPPPADGNPSGHQKDCIKRMLQGDPDKRGALKDKHSIIRGLLAYEVHFALRDSLRYVRDNYENPAFGEDLSSLLRLYETLSTDDVSYLATLAKVPLRTVAGWIDDIVGHSMAHRSSYDHASTGTTPIHATPAAIRSTPSRRSGSRAPSSPYPALHPTTLSQTGISIRVNKEPSFRFLNPKGRDCHECVRRGYKPGARTQLHTHIKERHLEDAQTKTLLYSTCPFCSEGPFTQSRVLADHIITTHTNNGPSSAPLSRSHSSSGPQGSPIPGPSPVNTPSYGQSMSMSPMVGVPGQHPNGTSSYQGIGLPQSEGMVPSDTDLSFVNTMDMMGNDPTSAPSHTNGYESHLAPPAYPQASYMNNGQQSFGYQQNPQPGYGYTPTFQNIDYQTNGGTQ